MLTLAIFFEDSEVGVGVLDLFYAKLKKKKRVKIDVSEGKF